MQEQLMQEYSDLVSQLQTLPEEIKVAKQDLTECQTQLHGVVKQLAEREAWLMERVEGKNAELRKAHLVQLKAKDSYYSSDAKNQAAMNEEIAQLYDDIDYLERSYGAVCYRSKLLAALMNYLGSAGAPVKQDEVQFMRPVPGATNGGAIFARTDEVTTADAEALGL